MTRRIASASTFARCAAVAALAAMTIPGGAVAARPLALEDLYRVREVADPQLSPDGRWVAYTVSSIDREQDESTSDIWMTSWDGDETLQLTSTPASESTPRFSPDGRFLAFLSDRGDPEQGAQVWLLDRKGGEARQVSHLGHAVTDYAWSPDGRRMVLVVDVAPAADDDEPKPVVIDRYWFKEDETGYLGEAREHLYLLEIDSGDAARLTEGPYDNRQPAWSPDGSTIAFVSKRGDDPDRHDDWDVYVREPRPGAPETRLPTGPGADDSRWSDAPPRFSPDGTRIAYERGGDPADIWYALEQVGILALADGGVDLPTAAVDRNTTHPRWSADGDRIYFLLEDDLGVQLAELRLRDGRIRRLTDGDTVVFDYDVGRDGRIVVAAGTAVQPAEVFRLDGERLLPLSRQNDAWLGEVDLRPAEEIAFDSADGLEIHGLRIAPAGDDGPFPLILKLHGGPVAQYQHEFDFEWQLYAAHGYLVAGVNPRGSSGRGYEFQKLLFADWGYADVPDILAAADHLVDAGGADPGRLGVGGWSYGGILTNYVIASTDRFRAAVSGSGMSNMLGGYGIDQYVRDWEAELGKPWENTDAWLRLSYPFLHADRIRTPTLFLCGADDFNVPLAASEQMYQALRSLGVPTGLVIYPGEYHSISRASFRIDRLQRYLDWYGRYLHDGS